MQRLRSIFVSVLLIAVLGILFMPPPAGMSSAACNLLAVTLLMAGLWMTQVIPLAATSLIPLALFPLLGIQTAKLTAKAFINDSVFLYVGGFILAQGIERWGLHQRIALKTVNVVGTSPRRLLLGFLLATGLLSMWISNTASTLLMLPIALALLKTLEGSQTSEADHQKLSVALLLSIAYSASLGGLATIVGTPTNNAAVGIYRDRYVEGVQATGQSAAVANQVTLPDITFADWMISSLPVALIYSAIAWFVLTRGLPKAGDNDQRLRLQLKERLTALGSASTAEKRMMILFVSTAIAWVFRKPFCNWMVDTFPDVQSLVVAAKFANDSTIAMIIAVLMFCLPSGQKESDGRMIPLTDWATARNLPWDIVLLFGGGFALADAFQVTGLSEWLGQSLQGPLQGRSPVVVVAVTCLLMTFLTEVTSNIATVNTLMPVMLAMSTSLAIDPRIIFVPATLATSCAFMLPIATPPNAIVFGTGRIKMGQMIRYGFLLNLIGIPLLTAATFLWFRIIMQLP